MIIFSSAWMLSVCFTHLTLCGASQPGFLSAEELLDLPLPGYVYCVPGKSNYLGGDIISGLIDTGIYREKELSVFF